jgi:hypothetical protein
MAWASFAPPSAASAAQRFKKSCLDSPSFRRDEPGQLLFFAHEFLDHFVKVHAHFGADRAARGDRHLQLELGRVGVLDRINPGPAGALPGHGDVLGGNLHFSGRPLNLKPAAGNGLAP